MHKWSLKSPAARISSVKLGGMSSSRCFFRYRRHRDVDDIVSISCQHRYLVIPRLHLRHSNVDDIVSISCQHRYPVIGGLSYLVYIVHVVDIAMLTISCRYRVYIGTLSYLGDIVNIVDIAILTISRRYRVYIGTRHTSFTSLTSSTSQC